MPSEERRVPPRLHAQLAECRCLEPACETLSLVLFLCLPLPSGTLSNVQLFVSPCLALSLSPSLSLSLSLSSSLSLFPLSLSRLSLCVFACVVLSLPRSFISLSPHSPSLSLSLSLSP